MKQTLGYVILGLVAYMLFLLWQFPAATAMGYLAPRLPGLTVGDIEGQLLAGQAHRVGYQGVELEQVTWRWRPLALLAGQAGVRLAFREPRVEINLDAGVNLDGRLRMGDLQGHLPLSRAMELLNLRGSPLEGRLELELERLELDPTGRPQAAQGTVRLVQTHTNLGNPLELGAFRVELTSDETGIQGQVGDEGGPVAVAGTFELAPDGRYRFQGSVGTRDQADPRLEQMLGLLGRPGPDGRWRVDFTGSL